MTHRGPLPVLAVLGIVSVAFCAGAARVLGGDALLAAELGLATLVGAWLILLGAAVGPAIVGHRRLGRFARRATLHRHDVHLLPGRESPDAFVVGPLRPTVFVSAALVELLDSSELRAVLLHEEHHRRTRAPLRSMALVSWGRLLGRVPVVVRWIDRRLAQLEIEADRYALAGGASPEVLASALIKCDAGRPGGAIAFSSFADARLRRLLGVDESSAALRAPIEWLGPMLPTLGIAACHLGQLG